MKEGTANAQYRYRPAWWLRSAHAQTMWGRFARRIPRLAATVEHISLDDGDILELHHLAPSQGCRRRVFMLHGLEGSPRSHYVGGVFSQAARRGWGASLLVFRGCGATPNRARRFYHSGETSDFDRAFRALLSRWPESTWFFVGVSLGGNVLLKWLGERGADVDARVRGAAAISVPFNLEAGARHIGRGFARVYDRSFLRSLRRKALAKLRHHPDLFDRERLLRARSIFDFDDAVTGPVHGFGDAVTYYTRSSSLHFLSRIRVPTLLLSARDDPFLPATVLRDAERVAATNDRLTVEFHDGGGHVGFVSGNLPWRPFYYAEWRAFRFFADVLDASGNDYDMGNQQ